MQKSHKDKLAYFLEVSLIHKASVFLMNLCFIMGKNNLFPSQNPLLEIGEYKFQDLCRELLEQEKNIVDCNDYEERGVAQYGADLIAGCDEGTSYVIGQCKCYKEFQPANFKTASIDFLKHLDSHWESYNIKRFILLLACDVVKTNQHTAINEERKRFTEKGILYEVWDKKRILSKLRSHPQIVKNYFVDAPDFWLEKICKISGGTIATQPLQTDNNPILNVSFAQAGKLSEIFSNKQNEELERIKELQREGRLQEAGEQLLKIRSSSEEWAILDNPVKAKILKFIAVNHLSLDKNTEKADELFTEALELDPEGDHTTFKATLEYYKDGAKAALKIINSPKKTDEVNQKIGYNLELNKPVEAIKLIESFPKGIEPDTETRRLHALALFESGNVNEAWVKINQVGEEKPLWEMVRIAKAIIGYYSGLSPVAFPAHPLSWAMPVLWQLVKRDDESILRFREAEKVFAQILESGNKHGEQKLIFESFRLACLANDLERQEEASRYFQDLVTENPAHPLALGWEQVRGFEIDYESIRNALETKIAKHKELRTFNEIDEIIALLDIYLRTGETNKAKGLLEKTKTKFQNVGGSAVYSFWLSRLAVIENKFDKALRIARSENNRPAGRQIQTMILRERYFRQKTNKKAFKPLVAYLEKYWRKTSDAGYLVELCYLNAEKSDWNFIAENYEQFITATDTADAVRIAAYALSQTNQPTKCLKVLEENKHKFPNSTLPAELVRLRVNSYTQQGVFSKAVSEAETLQATDDSAENLLMLIDAQLQKGDVAGITYNAQKILQKPDVEPKYILRVAKIAALEDAELAKKLWRRVKEEILDDPDLVSDALNIGFALGLDGEIHELMERMKTYAQEKKGSFQVFSFEKILQQMKKNAERQNKIHDLYAKGKMPLHFLAGENRLTLATLMHELPERNRIESDFRRCAKIFTRFGGRSMREGFFEVKPDTRLFMDITAFLLAAELGILEKVERMFAPIQVPSTLALALTAERQKLRSHQIAEISAHRRVIDALEKNMFEVFSDCKELSTDDEKKYEEAVKNLRKEKVTLILKAKNEGSFVVEHLPLSNKQTKPYLLPIEFSDIVINCRVIAESLHHFGHLEETEFNVALDKLGTDGNAVIQKQMFVPLDTKLYLDDYMVNALEKAGILDKTCRHFRVVADEGYIERIKAEISAYERDEKTAEWVQTVEKHLSDGFAVGTYVGISVEERQTLEKVGKMDNIDSDVVIELLQLVPQSDACIWIDDRSVNSHSHAVGTLLVTVTDILESLRRNGELKDEEYFNVLLRLRAGNFRYIPLSGGEILRHLRAAKIIDGKLVESDALAILRRYSAACLLDSECLQKPPMPKGSPNMFGELNFALEMTGSVSDAIIDLWNEAEDLSDAEIRANWLFDNFFVGKHGIRHLLPSNNTNGNGSHEMGVDFSEHLAKAIGMKSNLSDSKDKSRRQLYFDWLNRRLILPRLKADPDVSISAAKTLGSLFTEQSRQKFETKEIDRVSRHINADLFLDLPERISREMKNNGTVLEWLGVSFEEYFNFGEFRFLSKDFWAAAEKAVNGETAFVSTADSSKTLQLKFGGEKNGVLSIEFTDENNEPVEILKHSTLGVLFRDRTKRIEYLQDNRNWFDCETEIFEQEVEEIVSLADPRGRLERVNYLRKKSAAVYYENIQAKFEFFWSQDKGASINLEDLEGFPPSGLLRHYRIKAKYKPSQKIDAVLSDSAQKLLREEGLTQAIERLSHMPLKLPECLISELRNLSDEEKFKLFEGLAETLKSPLCKTQLIDLILRSVSENEKLLELGKNLVTEIYNEESAADFDLYSAILRFIGEEFNYFREIDDWSQAIRLLMIWAHAGKLFNLLQPVFGNELGFRRWFWGLHQHSSNLFGEKSEYLNDCLHPRRISRSVFLTRGVAALWTGNKRQDMEFLNIFEQVNKAIILKNKIPQLELFRTSELLLNSSNSMFGGDLGEIFSNFFNSGDWHGFSDESLRENVEQVLETLQKNQLDDYSWTTLSIIVGDSPIYDKFRERFVTLVKNLDFSSLIEHDTDTAIKALTAIIPQTLSFDDELKKKCEEWLYMLGQKFAEKFDVNQKNEITEKMIDLGYRLLEMVLMFSFKSGDTQTSSNKFKEMILILLNIWEEFGIIAETAIANMNATLPLDQTHHLPEILLHIRASKPQLTKFRYSSSSKDN